MRKREREKVIGKLEGPPDGEHGRPLCVRPYRSDEKMLDEITKETGESRSALVRRMIRFALSDRHERFGANRCRDRLDLLIDQGRRRVADSERLDEIVERVARLEDRSEPVRGAGGQRPVVGDGLAQITPDRPSDRAPNSADHLLHLVSAVAAAPTAPQASIGPWPLLPSNVPAMPSCIAHRALVVLCAARSASATGSARRGRGFVADLHPTCTPAIEN